MKILSMICVFLFLQVETAQAIDDLVHLDEHVTDHNPEKFAKIEKLAQIFANKYIEDLSAEYQRDMARLNSLQEDLNRGYSLDEILQNEIKNIEAKWEKKSDIKNHVDHPNFSVENLLGYRSEEEHSDSDSCECVFIVCGTSGVGALAIGVPVTLMGFVLGSEPCAWVGISLLTFAGVAFMINGVVYSIAYCIDRKKKREIEDFCREVTPEILSQAENIIKTIFQEKCFEFKALIKYKVTGFNLE